MRKQVEIEKKAGKPIGKVLSDLYQKHGTQVAVANELGVSQGTVSLWMKLSGLRVVSCRTVERSVGHEA